MYVVCSGFFFVCFYLFYINIIFLFEKQIQLWLVKKNNKVSSGLNSENHTCFQCQGVELRDPRCHRPPNKTLLFMESWQCWALLPAAKMLPGENCNQWWAVCIKTIAAAQFITVETVNSPNVQYSPILLITSDRKPVWTCLRGFSFRQHEGPVVDCTSGAGGPSIWNSAFRGLVYPTAPFSGPVLRQVPKMAAQGSCLLPASGCLWLDQFGLHIPSWTNPWCQRKYRLWLVRSRMWWTVGGQSLLPGSNKRYRLDRQTDISLV